MRVLCDKKKTQPNTQNVATNAYIDQKTTKNQYNTRIWKHPGEHLLANIYYNHLQYDKYNHI